MRLLSMLVLCLGLGPLPAFAASEIDYGYADIALVNQDGGGGEYEGLGVRASVPINPQFFAAAELSSTSTDNGAIDIDRQDFAIGAGYHMPLNRTTDFIAQIDFVSVETDIDDDRGLRLGAGLRSMIAQQLEVHGAIRYVDLLDGELVLDIGAQYLINADWAAFLDVSEGDDLNGYLLGARYSF